MQVKLKGVAETLLIPYYAKVYGSKNYKDKFYDEKTLEAFDKIDYDFSKFEKGKMSIWGILSRSLILDREAKNFIEKYPDAKCINIGCGFDTRFNRIDNGRIIWYGLDFPEVIEQREKLFSNNERENYIAGSALDENWASNIADNGKNVLIFLEGILMFLTEEEVKKIFGTLKKYFPKATILAEFMRPITVKNQNKHDTIKNVNANFRWGIAKSKDIEKICPELKFIDEWNLTKKMIQFSPLLLGILSPLFFKMNNTIVKMKII